MLGPVDRSIIVSAPHLQLQMAFSTSSSILDEVAELPMLALILVKKLRPIIIGSASGWLMLAGMTALPSATSLDFSLSRTIDLAGGESLVIRVGVNNLLGGSWVVQGYESNRKRMTSDGDFLSTRRGADALRYSYPRVLNLSINCRF